MMAMSELSFGSLGMPGPSDDMFSTGKPLAQRMFRDFCQTMTKSRYTLAPGACTVADALEAASSCQVAPAGITDMAATRPFCGCLIGSAGIRLRPPNSMGVASIMSTLRPN
ncbi:hypothetical protein D3C80_1176080 [compost metagenome]